MCSIHVITFFYYYYGKYQPVSPKIQYFFVISNPKLSPIQIRWTWCEYKPCHGDVLRPQLSPDVVGRRRPTLRLRRFPMRVPAAGEIFFNPNNLLFCHLWPQYWVRSRPDRRDVSIRHVMGYLEGQATVFRSDGNDWVRPRSDNVQPTFGGHQTTSPKIRYFFVISDPKLSPLQIR